MPDNPGVRRRNLARILRLTHLHGPHRRAELTEATGLNRSTIGDLVAELVSLGLVSESVPSAAGHVGRPSPIVAVDPRVVAIAVNPEVDALTIAAVGLDQRISVRERIDLDRLISPEESSRMIAERLHSWRGRELADHRVIGIGIAVPGLVRASDGLVREAPHLGWTETPLRDLVEAATGLPAAVGNDATMGAIAEHLFGAGRGHDTVVYLNGGASGIGGGLIIGGAAFDGAGGYAGEFGQNRPGIAADDDRRGGRLEDEVHRDRLLRAVDLTSADEPTLRQAVQSALLDPASETSAEVSRQRRVLAGALANAANVLNPSVIVLGGFLATILETDPVGLGAAVATDAMAASVERLRILPAELGEDRLLIGAAESAFAALLEDPAG